jgi:hypothetical protein
MKKNDLQPEHFRDLTEGENYSCTGGGFAYDVGRLIRFVIIAGPSGQWAPAAVLDAVCNSLQ